MFSNGWIDAYSTFAISSFIIAQFDAILYQYFPKRKELNLMCVPVMHPNRVQK